MRHLGAKESKMRKVIIVTMLLILAAKAVTALPLDDIRRAKEVNEWVHDIVTYVASPLEIKTPVQTLMTGGDCADMSALIVWILEDEGIEAEMLLLDLRDFDRHHAIVRVLGVLFDPVSGLMFTDEFPLAHKMNYNVSWTTLLVLANWK
jgi:hypothetical protein